MEMYKDVLRMLSKNPSRQTNKSSSTNSISPTTDSFTQNKEKDQSENSLIAIIPKGAEIGVSSTADRAVTLFQHLVGVGGYHPDLECYELLVKAFEVKSAYTFMIARIFRY